MRPPNPQSLLIASSAATLIIALWLHLYNQTPDFRAYSGINERKHAFIAYLCPIIEEQNVATLADRDVAVRARARLQKNGSIDESILQLGEKYSLTVEVPADVLIERLLRRADQLPAALVLAQAAIESGWGTSELFVLTRNLFGRRCFYADHCYAAQTSSVRYRRFPAVDDAVALYFRDLNTLMPYKRLRDLRALGVSDARGLADGLRAYSSRGLRYVQQIQRLIDDNNLLNACPTG